LACKRIDRTKSYINRYGEPWRIGGNWSLGTSFCGSIHNAKGHKGGECCYVGRTTIHRSVVEQTSSQIGVDNGRSTMKADGDGVAWSRSSSKKKMNNPK
jgi:hypothetical protein